MAGERLGRWGESIAADYLERAGWAVVGRNFRSGRREIDLVARRDGVVAFVEVKTRATGATGHPFDAIDERKQHLIGKVAEEWIERFGEPGFSYRFDAIAIARGVGGRPRVLHLPDAWRL